MALKKDEKWVVVVDGKEGKAYDGVSIPSYSPDSKHLAYAALSQGVWMVVVDGKEGAGRFSAIVKGATLVFTDNTHFHTMVLDPVPDRRLPFTRSRSKANASPAVRSEEIHRTEYLQAAFPR